MTEFRTTRNNNRPRPLSNRGRTGRRPLHSGSSEGSSQPFRGEHQERRTDRGQPRMENQERRTRRPFGATSERNSTASRFSRDRNSEPRTDRGQPRTETRTWTDNRTKNREQHDTTPREIAIEWKKSRYQRSDRNERGRTGRHPLHSGSEGSSQPFRGEHQERRTDRGQPRMENQERRTRRPFGATFERNSTASRFSRDRNSEYRTDRGQPRTETRTWTDNRTKNREQHDATPKEIAIEWKKSRYQRTYTDSPHKQQRQDTDINGGYWLYGRHIVASALLNPKRAYDDLFITQESWENLQQRYPIDTIATLPGISKICTKAQVEQVAGRDVAHQGAALFTQPLEQPTLEDLLTAEPRTLVLLDQIQDPQNVGAIMRSAFVFGANAVIGPQDGMPRESASMVKAAAGSFDKLPLVSVVNLSQTITKLRDNGYLVIGLAAEATTLLRDLQLPNDVKVAIVLGNEGYGLRRLVQEKCELLAKIPMAPEGIDISLNVSNAAAIALHHIFEIRYR